MRYGDTTGEENLFSPMKLLCVKQTAKECSWESRVFSITETIKSQEKELKKILKKKKILNLEIIQLY